MTRIVSPNPLAPITPFLERIKSELNHYTANSDHQPQNYQIEYFQQSCMLLKEQTSPTSVPRSSRRRQVKGQAVVRQLHQTISSDLFVLILTTAPKTMLCNFKIEWIDIFLQWWDCEEKPDSLSKISRLLCQLVEIVYRPPNETNTPFTQQAKGLLDSESPSYNISNSAICDDIHARHTSSLELGSNIGPLAH
ncbi:hypothetical protein BO78DRAFT_23748 [Aspergillus sclerotiicarbonarius CBS 121057]|uniref:Uncharacterized protein n=1 Tax=Aspergillus sclerotiicarbonarius (strain CBS 121057 / IBT 28362) TaxID=1448318 RepID=A0A319EKG7_ASPSB|nr:hypothetical protein BO78DRAFT_23748 [Aspergillus sclerotiicarbonarius CBS 121057]